MYMSMLLYMSEADIILHVCVELMLNRYTPQLQPKAVFTIHALMCVAYIRTYIVHIMHMCNA